jgi:hypothetical protein
MNQYQVVLSKEVDGVPAGTVFGEYFSYYSAVMAAEDSPFSDSLDICDLRHMGIDLI